MSDTREKRTRQLTIKGQTMFDEQQEQLKERCENIWIKIEDLMITVPSCHKLENIRQLNKDIEAYYKTFCRRSEEYKGYLSRANTVESQKFLTDHIDNFTKCVETFRKVSSEIKKKKLEFVEQLSEVSESSITSAVRIKRSKAEAEKVRLEFV